MSLLNGSIHDHSDRGASKEPKNPLILGEDSSVPLIHHRSNLFSEETLDPVLDFRIQSWVCPIRKSTLKCRPVGNEQVEIGRSPSKQTFLSLPLD